LKNLAPQSIIVVTFIIIVSSIGYSQTELHPRVVTIDPSAFPKITTYVTFYDENGNVIDDIIPSDFEIYERVRILPTRVIKLPGQMIIAMLIDKSGSMRKSMKHLKEAAFKFIDLMGPKDKVMVMAFDNRINVLTPFTSKKWALKNAINKLRGRGPTRLYDCVIKAIIELSRTRGNQKSIVLLTDGKDEARRGSGRLSRHTLESVIEYARKAGIPIHTIGLGKRADKNVLRKMAFLTHGKYYFAPSATDLMSLYEKIARNIKYQYKIEYVSPIPDPDIKVRDITVKPIFADKIYRLKRPLPTNNNYIIIEK